MKKIKQTNLKKILAFIVAICICLAMPITAYAAEGRVTYGSRNYVWYVGQTAPLGVYIESDTAIATYEIELSFDTTKLRYIDGASEQVEDKLYIRSGGDQTRYKHMLHFEVLTEGTTNVTVVSATATTVATETVPAENIQMVELSVAPIQITAYVGNTLSGLFINEQALQGFNEEILEYQFHVAADVKEVQIEAITESEDTEVEISETKLHPGVNPIDITVHGSNGEQVYKLNIMRPAPMPRADITEFVAIDDTAADEDTSTPEGNDGADEDSDSVIGDAEEQQDEGEAGFFGKPLVKRIVSNLFLWIATIAVLVLLIYYVIRTLKKKKKRIKYQMLQERQDKIADAVDENRVVVTIAHVTMKFKMAKDEASSIKEYFIRTLKRQNEYKYLTALNDVSFKVRQGDVVGIIGTNGSGKSTLLKIISGALKPTKGKVKVDRSKVQILTLGTGFDMELTARENVYLNGAIIGYSKEYIDEKYDDIVAFAELEGFMEQKMKNFSSGMVSRLGFAIATMRDTPEILILDEVLSVGDMFFRQKSEKRIREMIHSGATVFMVAHGMDAIRKNCNKVVWIEKGVMKMAGNPQKVCDAYMNYETMNLVNDE